MRGFFFSFFFDRDDNPVTNLYKFTGLTMKLLQIDTNGVFTEALKVSPTAGNGYGFALGILILALVAAGWLIRFLLKKAESDQEKREAQLEKAHAILASQNQHSEKVEECLGEIKTEQQVQKSMLQQLINRQ